MVMFTLAEGTPKSPAMLGMAVVRTVPSRNSMKNVAATSRASLGLQASLAESLFMKSSCHRKALYRLERPARGRLRPGEGVQWGLVRFRGPGTQKAPVRGPGPNAETGGFEPPVEFNPDPSLAVKSIRPLWHVSNCYY